LEGEFEGVTAEIGELDDFVALVVVAQNNNVLAQAGFGCGNAVIECVIRHEEVGIEVAAYAGFNFGRTDSGWLVYADEGAAIRDGYEVAHGGCCSCLEADAMRSLVPALEASFSHI
jgi:hypothetical protein